MRRAAAYCRVSTGQAAQLDSYAAQKSFFVLYCRRKEYELVHIYGDEGRSGTRISGRPQLMALLRDAKDGAFNLLLVKDVSRLARNVVDFLSALRTLKGLGVTVEFVNSDLTSSDGNEFILTILSAIAQEESAGLSRRIKFGKALSAQQGRVPNLVFGYRHTNRFTLVPDSSQALLVQKIFLAYVQDGLSMTRIAQNLNLENITTARGCRFSAKAVSRILSNPLYIGRVICRKTEISDFLTGVRRALPAEEQLVTHRPELRLVSDELFYMAQKKMQRQ